MTSKRTHRLTLTVATLVFTLTLGIAPARAAWGPPEIAVQGLLTNLADEPVVGPVELTFTLYDGQAGVDALWTEDHLNVELIAGHFDVLLGSINPLDAPPLFEQFDNLWVGIAVDAGPELPRAPLSAVGYALQARHAEYCGTISGTDCAEGEVLKWDGAAWACAVDNDTGYSAGWAIELAEGQVSADKATLDGAYVEEDQENSISNEMLVAGAVTDDKVLTVGWDKITGVPDGFADGVDNGLLIEDDPEVGLLGEGKWCTSNGLAVHCTADTPVLAEDDPQVGVNVTGQVPRWNGSALVAGAIFDDGDIGIGNTNPAGRLHVSGGLVRIGVAGTNDFAAGDGDLYVQDALEVDGGAWVAGTVTSGALVNAGNLENGGNIANAGDLSNDGKLTVEGNVDANGTADFAGVVDIHGVLDMNSQRVEKVATPTQAADAANKAYVDGAVQPLARSPKSKYTVVLALKNDAYCPNGYTVEDVETLKGPDNWLYTNINTSGLFLGGMNSRGYGQSYLYAGFNANNGTTKVCHKTYTSSVGRPHVSVIMPQGGDQTLCPQGYHYLPSSVAKGNNGHAYMMTNESGMYIGYVDTWDRHSHDYHDNGGYQWREWTSEVGTVCFRVMGVDEDPATADGVFPVFLGVKNETDCPQGWNVKTTSVLDSANGYSHLEMNGNSSVIGGLGNWGHGGNAYMQIHFHYSHVNFVCWNYFQRDGQPFHQIRTPHTGACPNGYTTFNADALKGWNANGYIAGHGHGLYMGGLHSWGMHDHTHGYIQHNFTNQVNNKVCLQMSGVQ